MGSPCCTNCGRQREVAVFQGTGMSTTCCTTCVRQREVTGFLGKRMSSPCCTTCGRWREVTVFQEQVWANPAAPPVAGTGGNSFCFGKTYEQPLLHHLRHVGSARVQRE
jgi:hypothetical protein